MKEVITLKNEGKKSTMKISSTKFNLQYFLSSMKKVKSLELGAKTFGGATHNLDTNELWSNCEGNEFINVNSTKNTVSIFVPTTVDGNKKATESKIIHMLQVVDSKMKKVKNYTTIQSQAIGSWYSEELQEVIIENIFIVSQEVQFLTEVEIQLYVEVANYVKKAMSQECVSLGINKALLLV
jgi:hypothetical protein